MDIAGQEMERSEHDGANPQLVFLSELIAKAGDRLTPSERIRHRAHPPSSASAIATNRWRRPAPRSTKAASGSSPRLGAVGRDLAAAQPGDAAVVFHFARYRRHVVETAHLLVEQDVEVVAITGGPLSPLAALTTNWCELDVPGIGPFDTSVPAVAIAELLVAQVASELRDEARERIDRTEAMWDSTDTFH